MKTHKVKKREKLWKFNRDHNEKTATNIKFPPRSATCLSIKTVGKDIACSSSRILIFSAGVLASFD